MTSQTKKIILFVAVIIVLSVIYRWGDVIFTRLQHVYYKTRITKQTQTESKIDTFVFKPSAYGGAEKEVKIYLPKGYADSDKKYPALYLLHGFPGSDSDWLINADLQAKLDDLINTKKTPELIVVFPDGSGTVTNDTQYINATKIKQNAEDYILDVVNEIDSRYKTIAKRESRAIGGLSAGAYGAVNIALHHNDTFAVIISHSGYFINNEGITKKLLLPDDLKKDYNNPLRYIQNYSLDPKTYIYLDVGSSDKQSYVEQNKKMDEILTQKGIEHTLNITGGWHDWEVWRKNIIQSLEFLDKFIDINN